ncbi:peptidylprolyl isomerase [Pusillimonas harenae]|uniref:Chaperone SurA n=2 Tax=Pollutimonas harenae TaxID=657015 RepID=A0A853H368_9BURK|nr:peptidylprolyl isomerase [Pollutimonas harenae]NYT86289.1 peptidylprolyl isomerase [Pollutimonas harenae]TEA69951.1 molecular chaperone SurA [Pollutimonas harenae]
MRSLHAKRWIAAMLMIALGALSPVAVMAAKPAAAAAPKQASQQFVDGIAAIVNKQVITLQQVNKEAAAAQAQLRRQNIPVPEYAVLQKQVLQRMIMEELERQEAERLGIKVTDAQVAQAVETIAQRNRITPQQLRAEIEKGGAKWSDYLADLRQQVRTDQLRQRTVDSTIIISDAEVDAFLKSQGQAVAAPAPAAPQQAARPAGPQILGLAQVLVEVPEGATSAQVQALRQKAEGLLQQLQKGADFGGVAAASSDGPQALNGGELGVRPVEGWPDLFISATQNLQAGQISNIIQSGNGFHILKVLTRGQPQAGNSPPPPTTAPQAAPMQQGPMMVTQTHARHILIKTTPAMSSEQAQTRLAQLRQRLQNGESFADLAKRYSDDATAPQGGDLGWLTPGETVPAFQRAMDALQPNEISQPVQSQFGWHLIQVLERRTKNMENEFRRMQARQLLFQRRVEPAFEDWLSQLRGQAYIDNRLDPASNRGRR